MEYVNQRGVYDDVPLAEMTADFARLYPAWGSHLAGMQGGDFLADVATEAVAAGPSHR
jgi:hypothetical protein